MTAGIDLARVNLARRPYIALVPVAHGQKKPTLEGWPDLRLTDATLPSYFNGGPANVGAILGEASDRVADVDLDATEAVAAAPEFLPATAMIHGRPSKRWSHYWYRVAGAGAIKTVKFRDPLRSTADHKAMLVEFRGDGAQSILPGSQHPSGERYEWDADGEPATVQAAVLRRAVESVAAAALLGRYWPALGVRHDAALALGGLFAHGGLDEPTAVRIVTVAARIGGSADPEAKGRDVADTYLRMRDGHAVTGGPTLGDLLLDGERIVRALRRWLGLRGATVVPPADRPTPTDAGNALRFAAQHGADVRYCAAWRSWLVWTGRQWARDQAGRVMELAKATARSIYGEAAAEPDETRRRELVKWARASESEPTIRRMLALAQSVPGIPVTPGDLDRDPCTLNCPNGTLELRTGHLRPHRREDLLTKLAAVPYDPGARLDLWERFLAGAIPDDGARGFAQRYAGYCVTGLTREEVFVLACGPAGSGKSTFTEALRRTWGDYAVSADFTTFAAKKPTDGPREDVARLAGARLVTSVETRDGQRFAEGLVKLLTGGDTVAARRLYEATFEFRPEFKLLFASNFRPRANAEDDGLWRRLRELPFPTARVRRDERDDRIKATLTDPAQAGAAILAWAVAGCAKWLEHGLGEPEAVMRATAAYRRSQEPLADFVADCCVLDPKRYVLTERLRQEYEGWAKSQGLRHPIAGKAWGKALRDLGCTDGRRDGLRCWTGIDVRLTDAPPPTDPPTREPGEDDPALLMMDS